MADQSTYVLFVMQVILVFCGRIEGCTFLEIQNCVNGLNEKISPHFVGSYNETELEDYCSEVNNTKKCISAFVDSCPLDTRTELKDMVNSDAYLCSEEGSELMVQNYECFRQNDTEALMRNCSLKFFDKTEEQGVSDEEWCDLVKEGLNCALTGMTEVCGQDAGHLIYRLQLTAHEYSAVVNNCTLTDTRNAAAHSHGRTFTTILLTAISLQTTFRFQLLL